MSISSTIQVRQASVTDLDAVASLFDGYRQFYGQPGDIGLARSFLEERFRNNQSVVFIATRSDGTAVGFAQLYPSFSSVAAARVFILNDIYVATEARRRGVGARLLQASVHFGRSAGAVRLVLSTAIDNESAQALYASQGWVRDTSFYVYSLSL